MNNDGLTLNQLAERNAVLVSEVEKLRTERDQLAAESVGLKAAINAVNRTAEECEVNGDELKYVVEPSEFEALIDFLDEPPATDRIVAGIKADGVEEFIGRLQQHVDEGDFVGDEVAVIVGAIDCGKEYFEQLREGAK